MVDLLAYLGVAAGWNFVFKPILEELAKDTAKDFAKDFCKGAVKGVLHGKDEWAKAAAKAFREFLEQFEQELIGAGETEETVKSYLDSLRRFTKIPPVRETLGSAVAEPDTTVDAGLLAQTWNKQNLQRLPDAFDWAKLSRRYQNKARAILRESAELRAILDSQHQQATAEATQRIAGIPADFDTAKYAEGLRKRYGSLKLETLDPNPEHQRIALTNIFVEQTVRSCQQFNPRVYELPLEYRRRLREQGGLEQELEEDDLKRQREFFLQQAPRPVLEIVSDPRERLSVVLGDPGCGKSVLLDYLALQWAELPPVDRAGLTIPLLIELKTYAENLGKGLCRDFLEYLDHGSGTVGRLDQKELHAHLQRGRAVLLLDGLDEIFDPPARQQVAQDLVSFTIKYPSTRFLVTSRIIGYDLVAPILRDAGFQHFLVQELDAIQQKKFIQRWHELAYADPSERAEKSGRLRDSIGNVAAIGELAQSPLLLTLMALLNRHEELPRDRNGLYEQASKLMLQQWDASKALREDGLLKDQSFDYKDKQAMLRAVAFRMQTSLGGLAGNIIAADDLEQTLVNWLQTQGYSHPRPIAVRLIQQLRERSFILCLLGADYFAFVHRTFLEFFCAWAWVWKFEKGEEGKRISIEQLQKQTFDAHWSDAKWHEVLRLIAARLEPQFAGQLIASLLSKQDLAARFASTCLAARCFVEVRNRTSLGPLGRRLEAELKLLARTPVGQEKKEAIFWEDEKVVEVVRSVALCWSRADSTKIWLTTCIKTDENNLVRAAAVQELARGWKGDPATLPILKDRARNDENVIVRAAAVGELAWGWKEDPNTLACLEDRARNDEDNNVRAVALTVLARGWKAAPETLTFLKDRAHTDENEFVRAVAVEALAHDWKEDPDTLPWLKDRAGKDQHYIVRAAAVQELTRAWKADPNTVLWLKERARNEKHDFVCRAAVRLLVCGWKADPDTLPWLKDHARNDANGALRAAAVQELARGWKDDPDTLPILKDRTRNDENENVRAAAMEELARSWKEDPDTLRILKDGACNDENYKVCAVALRGLARGWKEDPDTLPWLKDRVRNAVKPAVRAAAVEELARGWKDDPDTLPILKDCMRNDQNDGVRIAAVQELARGWKDDPGTLPWLQDCAGNDADVTVRSIAVQELAEGWKDDPDTLPILKDRACNDENDGVRATAVRELARDCRNPGTLPVLKDRARNDANDNVRAAAAEALARGWKQDPEIQSFLRTLKANA